MRVSLTQNIDIIPKGDDEEAVQPEDHTIRRSIVGGLEYLSVGTRTDISFST